MTDEAFAQPHQPRQGFRRWVVALLALLVIAALFLVVMQAVRRCTDASGSGQAVWGDLRPVGVPFALFLTGLVLLTVRAALLSWRERRLARAPDGTSEPPRERQLILLSLAILAIFFGVIFMCSQFALMGYPPCALEVAINPIATADYGPWPVVVFKPLDPKIGTQIALDNGEPTLAPEVVAAFHATSTSQAVQAAQATALSIPTAIPSLATAAIPTAQPTADTHVALLVTETTTVTETPEATETETALPTETTTATMTSTPSPIPTVFIPPPGAPPVPIPTALPTFTPTFTFTPMFTPALSSTPTETPTASETPTLTPTVTPMGTGGILREYWLGLPSGFSVSILTSSPNYPNSPSGCDIRSSFDAPIDIADQYGTRMRGYLYPPTSGNYRFWIASDDHGELWLSTDTSPANRVLVASVPGYTDPYEWNKYAAQRSALIALTAGQVYYIEAFMKENLGRDNLSAAWQGPGIPQQVIPGAYLSPAMPCIPPPPTATPTLTPTLTPTNTFTPTFAPTATFTLIPTDTPTNTPVPSANLYISVMVDNPTPNVGDTIQYTISYGNLGPDTATGVQMSSPLPSQVDYAAHSGGTFNPAAGQWTMPDLTSGQSGSATITVTVRPEAAGSTVPSSVSISSVVSDPDGGNNSGGTSFTAP